MRLTSPAFQDNTALPATYTCTGKGVSPPLFISDVPETTQSLALIMHDPDAVNGKDFTHWLLWNISPETKIIGENTVPVEATQGVNDYPAVAYGPACPPVCTGLHRYVFDLYALDTMLDLPNGSNRNTLEAAMHDRILETARLVGIVQA
jgi:Raf kinase inhibitor-like YbhB/YbcL family protein